MAMYWKVLVSILIAVTWSLGYIKCNIVHKIEVDTIDNSTELVEKWKSMEKKLDLGVKNVLKSVLPMLLRASSQVDLSDECTDSLTSLIFGLGQFKPWAVKMIDAFGKPVSGILDGTLTSVGAYDQCMDIEVNPNKEQGFRGQYCAVTIRPPLPTKPYFYRMDQPFQAFENFTTNNFVIQELKDNVAMFYSVGIRIGACVPSVCNQQDVQTLAQSIVGELEFYARVTHCHVKDNPQLEVEQVIIIFVILTFVMLVVIATTLHIYFYKNVMDISCNDRIFWQLVRCFSIPFNVPRIMNTTVKEENKSLQCLHGVKFLTIAWVTLGHTYYFLNPQTMNQLKNVKGYGGNIAFQAVQNGIISVDTFFFVSGVVLSNITIRKVNEHGVRIFSIPIFLCRRIYRIIPSALLALGLFMLLPLVGSGPFWHENMDAEFENCKKNWWAILLSVNNFMGSASICLNHTWYISCDLQLFCISLVFLFCFFKKRYYGFLVAAFMIIVSIVAPGTITYFLKHPPTQLLVHPDVEDIASIQNNNYFLPFAHSGVYAVGLLFGYFLTTQEKINIPLVNKIIN